MVRGGMQDVELGGAGLDASDVDERPPERSWRRPWVVPAVAVAVVLGLLGYQAVVDARQRAAFARLASVPGVLTHVDEGLPVRWQVEAPETDAMVGPVVDGASVGLVVDPDGSQRVVAVDLETGTRRWSTEVYDPDEGLAGARAARATSGYCQPVGPQGEVPDRLACEVSDGSVTWEGTRVAPTETFVRVVDTHDGHLLGEWQPSDDDSSLGVLGRHVVLAHWDSAGGVEVVAHEPDSGSVVWSRHLDVPDGTAVRGTLPTLQSVGGVLEVSSGIRSAWLDDDGVPLAVQPSGGTSDDSTTWLVDTRSPDRLIGVTYDIDGPGTVEVLHSDGTLALALPGELVGTAVDDGSLPNMLLTVPDASDPEFVPGALRATDVTTGTTSWTADIDTTGGFGALVLLGQIYVTTLHGIDVLDGHSGQVLWTVDSTGGAPYRTLLTDGRYLLAVRSFEDGVAPQLEAYQLTGGQKAWTAPVPDGYTDLYAAGHVLVGVSYDETQSRSVLRVARIG